ncbi:hypothetical protein [Maritimibacter alkaliphilus]|uniref:hypothetical protein n=1 Tax=Maritimibacter alkaliphilus TaxID=404236 RepID=UPI001C94B062|nr:hypothetical protein [Maritimibacter alkaliphilus]MBY6091080.1 hypothetical protein [Maritimibacter alkaliphilus]
MALTFPLSTALFFDLLPISRVTFRLGAALTSSETGGGEVITHRIGARLWTGEITLDKDRHRELAAVEALIALLEEPGASFLLHDKRQVGPRADPDGTVLGAAEPLIADLATDMSGLSLQGLPEGYSLSPGDYLGFSYGSAPTRHALHRLVTGGTASASGTTPTLSVVPALRLGVAPGTPVQLVSPSCKARLSSADYGTGKAVLSEGGTLSWTQTLR